MRSHHVHHDVSAKPGEIVHADDRIARDSEIRRRFVFEQKVNTAARFKRPFHVRDEPDAREPLQSAVSPDVPHEPQGPVLIEEAISQVGVGPCPQIKLPTSLGDVGIDADGPQAVKMFVAPQRVNNVNRLLTGIDAIPYEWEQHAVFVITTAEERAHVTVDTKCGTTQANRSRRVVQHLWTLPHDHPFPVTNSGTANLYNNLRTGADPLKEA